VSTVQDIKKAIEKLSGTEREKLIAELPKLFPELDGDAAWERIIHDPSPRPGLTVLLDQAEAEYRRNPTALTETSDAEFDRHS
jgi:hypothetical protein